MWRDVRRDLGGLRRRVPRRSLLRHRPLERTTPSRGILLAAQSLGVNDPVPVQESLLLDLGILHVRRKLLAVANVPLREEIVLDPEHFAKRFDDRRLLLQLEPRVR